MLWVKTRPQGDGRKAELVNRAVQLWDSAVGEGLTAAACARAGQFFGVSVPAAEVEQRVGNALCALAEQVIADFGESIEPSEIDLLNTLDACRRLPEPRGAAAAGDAVMLKQIERIDRYVMEALPVVNGDKGSAQGVISESEIKRLVAGCREARQAFALLQRRPALFHRLPPDKLMGVSTISIALGFQLGWNHSKWQEAAELAAGVLPEHIDQRMDVRTRNLFIVSCRALPLMARVAKGNDMTNELEGLKRFYPHCTATVDGFKQRALEMLGRAPRFQPAAPARQSEITPGGCVLAIIGAIIIFVLRSGCERGSSRPSYSPNSYPSRNYEAPRPVPTLIPPVPRARLTDTNNIDRASLDTSEKRVRELVERVKQLGVEINEERPKVNPRISSEVSDFNAKVQRYRQQAAQAKAEMDVFNVAVRIYNESLHPHDQ